MTQSGGYQVDPNELHTFASYLSGTTHSEITDAANGVRSANGFDDNAFGIFAAQLLAVPARIAMAVAVDNLNSLGKEISDADFAAEFTRLHEIIEELLAAGRPFLRALPPASR